MNKIKLIKSFANYSLWEYVLNINEEEYVMTDDYWSYYIHKDIVEWMKDHFEEVKERPTSWEKLWEVSWYFIEMNSDIEKTDSIFCTDEDNKNIFKTKSQAEAAVALAMITQLLDKYDIPEESYEWYYYAIGWYSDLYMRRQSTNHALEKQWLLWFDTREKCEHFHKHHAELIKKLAPFYIF